MEQVMIKASYALAALGILCMVVLCIQYSMHYWREWKVCATTEALLFAILLFLLAVAAVVLGSMAIYAIFL